MSKRRRDRPQREMNPPATHLRILATIARIPEGSVATYGQVAKEAGLPGRARLVGYVLRVSPLGAEVPWHRVIAAAGRISIRRGGGPGLQRELLLSEGVEIDSRGMIELSTYRWKT